MHTLGRRGFFLSALAGLMVADHTLDPERLLWVPGNKLISIPRPMLPGLVIRIPIGTPWPNNLNSSPEKIMSQVNQFRGNREIMEAGYGQQIFAVRDSGGRLISELQMFLAPEGVAKSQHYYLDASKFQQVTLNA